MQRGDRIGIVGPNGAGKTTLVDMLTGAKPPDSGTIRFGANIEMATLDQHRESLDPKSTLAEALTGGRGDHVMVGGKPKHVVSYMKDFLFAQEQMRTPLEVLSGGERGRLMLARALAKPSNLLVLDEPTNDLDLETLDVLEEMLGDYEGTVILISHDRDFLDRVVTSVIAPEGDGRWIEYAGGYSDMLAQRGADLKREAVKVAARRTRNGSGQAACLPPYRSAGSISTKSTRWKRCRRRSPNCRPKSPNSSGILTIPICSRRIAGNSIKPLMRLQKRKRNCRRPRTSGLSLKCCAKRIEQA